MAIQVMGIDYGKHLKRQHEALKARLRYAQELDDAVKAGVCTPKQAAEHKRITSMWDKYGGVDPDIVAENEVRCCGTRS